MKKLLLLAVLVLVCILFPAYSQSERMVRPSGGREAGTVGGREMAPAVGRQPIVIKPNLILQSLSLSRTEVFKGDEVIATVGVACEGEAVNDPVRVRFSLGVRTLGDEMVVLRQGRAGKAIFKFTAAIEGTHKIVAHVNPDGKIPELNPRDNTRSAELAIKRLEVLQKESISARTGAIGSSNTARVIESTRVPEALTDLVLMALRVDKPAPSPGEEITVTARIQNIGSQDLESVFTRLFLDGKPAGRIMKTDVGAGRIEEVKTAFEVESAGAHEIKVQVDPDNRIPELDDHRNNVRTLTIAVAPSRTLAAKGPGVLPEAKGRAVPEGMKALVPRPALLIRSLSPSKNPAPLGELIRAEALIGNQSEEDLDQVRIAFFLGERQIGAEQHPQIPQGGTRDVATQFKAEPVGAHLLKVNAFPPAGGRYEKTAPFQVMPPMAVLNKPGIDLKAFNESGRTLQAETEKPGKPHGPEVAPEKLTAQLSAPVLTDSMKTDSTPIEITILSPTANSSWPVGSTLDVRWKTAPMPKPFHVFLLSNPQDKTAEAVIAEFKTFKPDQQGIFSDSWPIPSYVKPGNYVVKIIYIDDPSVFSVSGSFKIGEGGPAVIAPAILYSGPSIKGFEVFRPGKNDAPERNKMLLIAWGYLPSVLKDPAAYAAMGDKVRIILNSGQGVQYSIIVPSTSNQHPISPDGSPPAANISSSFTWAVPGTLPDGKYVVRVETLDGHFHGDSEPFTLWSQKEEKLQQKDKSILQGSVGNELEESLEKKLGTSETLPVEVKVKVISITPHTQDKVVWKIDVLAEIDANTEFKFGDYRVNDPLLSPVLVKPEIYIKFRMEDANKTVVQPLSNYGILRCDAEAENWGDPYFSFPAGVMKKGKNIVKFTYTGFNKPYCGPLELRWNQSWGNFDGLPEGSVSACTANLNAHIEVILRLMTAKKTTSAEYTDPFMITIKEPRIYFYDQNAQYGGWFPCKKPYPIPLR